jgi:Flp pilus assembly pilin Flp
MILFLRRLWKEVEGQDMVEYAIAVGMMAVCAVAVMPTLPDTVTAMFSKVGSLIQAQFH